MSKKTCALCKGDDIHSFTLNIGQAAEINRCNFCGHEWTSVNAKPATFKKKRYKVENTRKPQKVRSYAPRASISIDDQEANFLRSRTRRNKPKVT